MDVFHIALAVVGLRPSGFAKYHREKPFSSGINMILEARCKSGALALITLQAL